MALITQEAAPLLRTTGRSEGIEALFQEHYPGLCRLAYLIVGDRRAAEEVVMEAFLRTFSAWGRIRSLDRSDLYLRRAVINLSRTRSKGGRREEPVHDEAAPSGGSIEGRLDVWDAVQLLPERQRIAVVLRYFQDLPDAQIARLMRCSEGTVKSQLSKARATLGKLLKEENNV